MTEFKLPDQLPTDATALAELLKNTNAELDKVAASVKDDGAVVSEDTLTKLETLVKAVEDIDGKLAAAKTAETERAAKARELVERTEAARAQAEADKAAAAKAAEDAQAKQAADAAKAEAETEKAAAEVVAEAEKAVAEAPEPAVTASTSFKGLAAKTGNTAANVAPKPTIGWRMHATAPGRKDGVVGFDTIAKGLDTLIPGSLIRTNRPPTDRTGMVPLALASLDRGYTEETIFDESMSEQDILTRMDELASVHRFERAKFDQDGALVASAGWCAPSETSYEFCGVPPVHGLISLPGGNFSSRGGIRFPNEPDFTTLYSTLPAFFTETQLTADPEPTKPCVEIPCVGFTEVRAEAMPVCVTAGILQRRGFPELIAKFMAETMRWTEAQVSVRTIAKMVAGSDAVTVPEAQTFGAAGSLLNSLEYQAHVIRAARNLGPTALVEIAAPDWLPAVIRADLTYNTGRDVKSVTDAEIDGWFRMRNIAPQWVAYWQGLSQTLATTTYSNTVQVLMWEAGAWFQHRANVVNFTALYDKAQLQQNRYTELFLEDEYAVWKRCGASRVITVPICANGATGGDRYIACGTTDPAPATGNVVG